MFQKTFSALMLFLAAFQTAFSQNEVTSILYLNKGQSLNYEMVDGRKNYKNDKLKDSSGVLSKIRLTVLDSTDKSYVFRYEIESPIPELKGIRLKKSPEKIAKEVGNLQIQYKTSEMGEFEELKNKAGIVSYTKKMLSNMEPEKNDKELEKFFENFKATVFSDKFIEAKITENIQLMHGIYGGAFALDSLNSFEFEEENVLNPTKPFHVKGTSLAYFDEDDPEVVVLEIDQTYRGEEVRNTIVDLFKNAGGDKKALEEMKKAKLDMEVSQLYAFLAESGVLLFVSHQKKIYLDKNLERVDFKKFTLVD